MIVRFVSLLQDCYYSYFACRTACVEPIIREFNAHLDVTKSLIDLTNETCQFVINLGFSEYLLFYSFFDTGEQDVLWWLEGCFNPLFDTVRPIILKESSLDVLSALCHSMNALVSTLSKSSFSIVTADDDRESLISLFESLVQDCQTRLVFKIQNFVRVELQPNARIESGCLDYPDIIRNEKEYRITLGKESVPVFPFIYKFWKLLNWLHNAVKVSVKQYVINLA